MIADDYIRLHLVAEHEELLREFKLQADKHGYTGNWHFYKFDDGRHVAFNGMDNTDFDATQKAHSKSIDGKLDKAFFDKYGEVDQQTISKQNFFMMRYRPDLSNERPKDKSDPMNTIVWIELQLNRNYDREAVEQWVVDQKKQYPTQYYSMYSKMIGANTPTTYLVLEVESAHAFYHNLAKRGPHDWVELLPKNVRKGIDHYHVSIAQYVPDIR